MEGGTWGAGVDSHHTPMGWSKVSKGWVLEQVVDASYVAETSWAGEAEVMEAEDAGDAESAPLGAVHLQPAVGGAGRAPWH